MGNEEIQAIAQKAKAGSTLAGAVVFEVPVFILASVVVQLALG